MACAQQARRFYAHAYAYACGVPVMSGFVGKLVMLAALLEGGADAGGPVATGCVLLLASGLLAITA